MKKNDKQNKRTRLSKEFLKWYMDYLKEYNLTREQIFGDKKTSFSLDYREECVFINIDLVYNAFNAHNEELKRLRRFEKKILRFREKCAKLYREDIWKYDDELEKFMYL